MYSNLGTEERSPMQLKTHQECDALNNAALSASARLPGPPKCPMPRCSCCQHGMLGRWALKAVGLETLCIWKFSCDAARHKHASHPHPCGGHFQSKHEFERRGTWKCSCDAARHKQRARKMDSRRHAAIELTALHSHAEQASVLASTPSCTVMQSRHADLQAHPAAHPGAHAFWRHAHACTSAKLWCTPSAMLSGSANQRGTAQYRWMDASMAPTPTKQSGRACTSTLWPSCALHERGN